MIVKPVLISKESPIDQGFMTYLYGYGTPITIGVYFWLIEGAEKKIIVDTGASGDLIKAAGFPGINYQSQEEALEKMGLSPEDIEIVILTHLHFDHAADMEKFKKAVFYLQKDELAYAQNPHPTQQGWFVLPPADLRVELIEGDQVVVPGVEIKKTPGHTPGTQSVLVDTDKGKLCISGLCTIEANYYPPEEAQKMGFSAFTPGIHINALEAFDSVMKIKEKAEIVIAPHDIKYAEQEILP